MSPSPEREARDTAEALEARIATLQEQLARATADDAAPRPPDGALRDALVTETAQLVRRELELQGQVAKERAAFEARRAAREAEAGWETRRDDRITQDETTGAAVGCALVVLPLLGANALFAYEGPGAMTAVAVVGLVLALAVAARHELLVGRGQRRGKSTRR